jgi:lysozyme family protein
MNQSALEFLLSRVIEREGGIAYLNDSAGSGPTRWGQTEAWLATHRLPVPMNAFDALKNYVLWAQRTRLSDIATANDALSNFVLDFAVHSGERHAIRTLQKVLNVTIDGTIGPETLKALYNSNRRTIAIRFHAHRERLIGALLAKPANTRFAKGWLNRLADLTELL